jgi:hypothetical protein
MTAVTADEVKRIVQEALAPVLRAITGLQTQVTALDTKVTALDDKVTSIDTRLTRVEAKLDIVAAKQNNSMKTRNEPLERVPLPDGQPFPANTEYPATISSLLVSGNEKIPGTNTVNTWNREKSLAVIRLYDAGYETDDNAQEQTSSRKRRLKLAKLIGVRVEQLDAVEAAFNAVQL